MSPDQKFTTKRNIKRALRARKIAREQRRVLIVLSAFVALIVTGLFMHRVLAAKLAIRVLDCPVEGVVAHHHNELCYDDEGFLVCSLPERDLHVHTDSCYERALVCGLEEGAGAHAHDESCYDSMGNLVCQQEESSGHHHTDECYEMRLVCTEPEIAEEHVHGDGCFKTIAANEDAVEATHPSQHFHASLEATDDTPAVTVDVDVPVGVLPDGASMVTRVLSRDIIDVELLQKAVEREAAKNEQVENGRVLDFQAVNITFNDIEGKEIKPDGGVTVTLTSDLAHQGNALVLHLEGQDEAILRNEGKDADQAQTQAEVLGQLDEEQLKTRHEELEADQVAFESNLDSIFVLAVTSQRHEMCATDGVATSITVTAPADAGIPSDAYLAVNEIGMDTAEYEQRVQRSVEASGSRLVDVALARFFDIKILNADGQEIQPAAPVDVRMELADTPEQPDSMAVVHFHDDAAAEDDGDEAEGIEVEGESEGPTPEVPTPETVEAQQVEGAAVFQASSFSVYGVVYTVDFEYTGDDGLVYQYSMPGGGVTSLRELAEALHLWEGAAKSYKDVDAFMDKVKDVAFTDPALLWIGKVGDETGLPDIVRSHDLHLTQLNYATPEEYEALEAMTFTHDWVLISQAPFTTNEALTITMKDGSQRIVLITDAQDAPMKPDGSGTVDTITNPPGTTIDLFDYWIRDDVRYSQARGGWPGYDGFQTERPSYWSDGNVIGFGNEAGINKDSVNNHDHHLKFSPANGGTVADGPLDGNGHLSRRSGADDGGMNTWTGDADPMPGLVAHNLDANGYPVLSNNGTLGTNGEALDYLFDHNDVSGKQTYDGVDHLLYVDSEGYYNYNSHDYWVDFNRDTKRFTLTPQTSTDTAVRGFWPFGDRVYWMGVHVDTPFSMPFNGQVLNPKGHYKDMAFHFEGDDDTWIYIDGVLVGDGGGIHNRTSIDINFATGKVIVSGKKDDDHMGSDEYEYWLDDLFRAAWIEQGKTEAEIAVLMAETFDIENNKPHVFKADSHHNFDMFYLERGGGESNMAIRYNLISIVDFTAHKEYRGATENDVLKRDDYQFELVGLDGRYNNAGTLVDADRKAIMPKTDADTSGAGTVASPYFNNDTSVDLSDGSTQGAQIYRTGVTEDGNVNFGFADIPAEDIADLVEHNDPPTFYYIIREVVPDDAVNAHGKAYRDCNAEERENGIFVYNDLVYMDLTYYMAGTVYERSDGSFGLQEVYYTDDRFQTVAGDIYFANVKNRYAHPVELNVFKENAEGQHEKLSGAVFKLTYASYDSQTQKYYETPGVASASGTTGVDGKVSFADLKQGVYILEEATAPEGFDPAESKWLVELIPEQSDPDDMSTFALVPYVTELNLDGTVVAGATRERLTPNNFTISKTIQNVPTPQFAFTVEKHWTGVDPGAAALAPAKVNVTIGRYKLVNRAGILHITKTGVPADAVTQISYIIEKDNGDYVTTITKSSWDPNDPKVDDIPLPPGTYRVTERIDYDDYSYSQTHNGGVEADSVKTVTIVDEGEATAAFTSEYTEKLGSITIKSTLNNSSSQTVDPSGVTYTVYKGDSVIGTYTYGQVTADENGLTISDLRMGTYRVVESVWPNVSLTEQTHSPITGTDGTVTITDRLINDGDSVMYAFSTTYEDKTPCTLSAVRYQIGETINQDVFAGPTVIYGDEAVFTFTSTAIMKIFVGQRFDGIEYGYNEGRDNQTQIMGECVGITWSDPDHPWNEQTATVTIPIPRGTQEIQVFVGSGWGYDNIKNGNFAEAPSRSANRSNAQGGSAQAQQLNATSSAQASNATAPTANKSAKAPGSMRALGVSAGQQEYHTNDTGKAPATLAEDPQKYVLDQDFSHVVELTQADDYDASVSPYWQELVEDLPMADGDGNKYYYYIKRVDETGMPKNNELTVIKESNGDQVLAFMPPDKDLTKIKHLAAANDIGTPADISLIKVEGDEQGDPTATKIGGAVFHVVKTTTVSGQSTDELMTDSDLTVTEMDGTTTVTVDSLSGQFTVPENGVKILQLDPGTYKLVEDQPPAGYIISNVEYPFTITHDGALVSQWGSQLTMTIPNPPGEELPSSGVPRDVAGALGMVAGAATLAFGLGVLLKNSLSHLGGQVALVTTGVRWSRRRNRK